MNLSYWEKDTYFSNIDVLVIGSGIVGLSAALELKTKNNLLKIMVVERGFLPSGASSKNAGFACFGSISEILSDFENDSEEIVYKLISKRWNGLKRLRSILGDDKIEYKNWGGFELFKDEILYEKCSEKMDYLNNNLADIIGSKDIYKNADKKIDQFGFKSITHLIENSFEGQINTGKMIATLIKKVQESGVIILNSLTVKSIDEEPENVQINLIGYPSFKVKKVLVATNGFAKQLLPELNVNPARAQVIITKPIAGLKIEGTFHYDQGYYYFRNIENRVLLGGGRNIDFKSEETTEMIITEKIQNTLEELLKSTILPNIPHEIDQRWSGIMGIGNQKTAIIKAISKNIFCAVRMGGMGIAIGSLVGQDAANMVQNEL